MKIILDYRELSDKFNHFVQDSNLKALLAERNRPMFSEHLKPGSTPGQGYFYNSGFYLCIHSVIVLFSIKIWMVFLFFIIFCDF
jgi:hypothetical protein